MVFSVVSIVTIFLNRRIPYSILFNDSVYYTVIPLKNLTMFKISKQLEYENAQVLNLVQALIGAISPNFRRVYLSTISENVKLSFIIEKDVKSDREEISDIVSEFEALQIKFVDIDFEIIVNSNKDLEFDFQDQRTVYARKEY